MTRRRHLCLSGWNHSIPANRFGASPGPLARPNRIKNPFSVQLISITGRVMQVVVARWARARTAARGSHAVQVRALVQGNDPKRAVLEPLEAVQCAVVDLEDRALRNGLMLHPQNM